MDDQQRSYDNTLLAQQRIETAKALKSVGKTYLRMRRVKCVKNIEFYEQEVAKITRQLVYEHALLDAIENELKVRG